MTGTPETTTSRKAIVTGAFFSICLVISLVCMAVAIRRGDRQGAAIIFVSVGLSARSFALWLDRSLAR